MYIARQVWVYCDSRIRGCFGQLGYVLNIIIKEDMCVDFVAKLSRQIKEVEGRLPYACSGIRCLSLE